MRAADAGRAHSLASCIVFSVFCIVSFVSISLVIIISEHTVAINAERVDDAWGLASSGGGEAFAQRARARCASGQPADGQPVASASSITSSF